MGLLFSGHNPQRKCIDLSYQKQLGKGLLLAIISYRLKFFTKILQWDITRKQKTAGGSGHSE
jgi:hypothetical protein